MTLRQCRRVYQRAVLACGAHSTHRLRNVQEMGTNSRKAIGSRRPRNCSRNFATNRAVPHPIAPEQSSSFSGSRQRAHPDATNTTPKPRLTDTSQNRLDKTRAQRLVRRHDWTHVTSASELSNSIQIPKTDLFRRVSANICQNSWQTECNPPFPLGSSWYTVCWVLPDE